MPQLPTNLLGWNFPRRKKFLDELVATKGSASKYSTKLMFRNRTEPYPVYVIPLDLPKYRLENGRTQAAQEEYLALHPKLPKDFFRIDKESDQVQTIQHELLSEMLYKNNMLSYFRDIGHKQSEPLILSSEGYVVNGNRRLCGMRTLFYEDQGKFSHFENIDVVILPVCDPKDIDELEAYLQMKEDIKADYTWIAEACMLRARRVQYGYDDKALARIYDKQEKEIKAIFQRLSLVDEYLSEIKNEKRYDLVEDKDYAFKVLQKGRQSLKDDDKKELFTQLSYALIEHSSDVEGRLYDRIPSMKENINQIADRLKQEMQISDEINVSDSKFKILGSSTTIISPITKAVTDAKDKTPIVETVIDVIDGEKEKARQQNKANSILKEVTDANSHLINAVNYINISGVKKIGVAEQISTIEESIKVLKQWLTKND